MKTPMQFQGGFTMIELLVAMAVFSFMLLIISVGFINVVRLHNQAIAANVTQDSANSAMQALVQAVRDSTGVDTALTGPAPAPLNPALGDLLCLKSASGIEQAYFVNSAHVLMRADNCATRTNQQPLTAQTSVKVTYFTATIDSTGPNIRKPEVAIALTLESGNGTATSATGPNVQCGNSSSAREFCSVMTLTSGAVPR